MDMDLYESIKGIITKILRLIGLRKETASIGSKSKGLYVSVAEGNSPYA